MAVQDGVDAGQSVPHVHVHVIPRRGGDMDDRGGGDAIYELMDGEEGDLGSQFLDVWRRNKVRTQNQRGNGREFSAGPDSERAPRSEEEMKQEAEWLRKEMEEDDRGEEE